jgi:lipopolysaccharide transport system ATP-binding protein
MSDIAIKVESLGKLYRLGEVGTGTISHDLNRWVARVRGKEDPFAKIGESNDRTQKGESDYVWAIKDVNFEVKKGEVLGIIGKNGAGKSTLLKLLSKVTQPTSGSIKVNGRIASLLEVGTGFHPEMTGRENIFLNGAIMGMTKREIKAKFDEIVDFAGVERYVDTPVKRYSSGMYVRLAFAVAAHLEPEILIVDEVLAVGDAEFQKKCLGKMKDVSVNDGRTVLFVSHNMASVKSLCTKGLILEHGGLKLDTDVDSAVGYYLSGDTDVMNRKRFDSSYDKERFKLTEISLNSKGKLYEEVLNEKLPIELNTEIEIKSNSPERYHVTYHLYNELGEALFSFSNVQGGVRLKEGVNKVVCTFPADFFQSGQYYLSIFIIEDNRTAIFVEKDIMAFTIVDGGRELGVYQGREPGYIKPVFEWFLKSN